jgi:hypothetical protein
MLHPLNICVPFFQTRDIQKERTDSRKQDAGRVEADSLYMKVKSQIFYVEKLPCFFS